MNLTEILVLKYYKVSSYTLCWTNEINICRENLIGPLFKVLEVFFSDKCTVVSNEGPVQASSDTSEITTTTVCHIQQTATLVLEDIISSLNNAVHSEVSTLS